MTLNDVALHTPITLLRIGGERAFRRRLMELGLIPGTPVVVSNVAPLGDPLELRVRDARLSIRRAEADQVEVQPLEAGGRAVA